MTVAHKGMVEMVLTGRELLPKIERTYPIEVVADIPVATPMANDSQFWICAIPKSAFWASISFDRVVMSTLVKCFWASPGTTFVPSCWFCTTENDSNLMGSEMAAIGFTNETLCSGF